MTEAHPMTSIDKLERERASEILLKHLSKQGFGGSTVKSGYFARRDQLTIDAMLEFAIPPSGRVEELERVLGIIADENSWKGFSPLPIVERMRELARAALGSHNG